MHHGRCDAAVVEGGSEGSERCDAGRADRVYDRHDACGETISLPDLGLPPHRSGIAGIAGIAEARTLRLSAGEAAFVLSAIRRRSFSARGDAA